jgi:nucleoid DNA-binding protein
MFLRELNKAFLAKENIEIRNFGRFKIVKGAARKGKNLSTGKPMEIPAQYRVRFYPSSIIQSKMKEIIK